MKIKNFTDKELSCRCGCGEYIDDEVFLYNLQRLREMYGSPMYLSSAKRCPEYNVRVSSTGPEGPHTKAAVDVVVYGREAYRLLWMAMASGFTGIGVSQKGPWADRFLHLDRLIDDNRPWVWTY